MSKGYRVKGKGQKAQGIGQRSEVRGQMTENRGQRAEGFECGMWNKERRSWEGWKLRSSKLNAQREPSAVGGALRLRFEVGGELA